MSNLTTTAYKPYVSTTGTYVTTTGTGGNSSWLLGGSLFDEIFRGELFDFPSLAKKTTQGYPVVDIYNTEDGTVLEFALAGFSREELSIDVLPEKSSITVKGEVAPAVEGASPDMRRIARRNFQKTYVDYGNVLDLLEARAEYTNGLLTITVPKKKEAPPVKVNIM